MSAVESSTVGMKTMADGTLRLTLDIEPRFAKAAFGLFGAPGTPCAIAALRIGAPAPAEPEKPKGGPLAKLAGMWCGEKKFQDWTLSLRSAKALAIGMVVPPPCDEYARLWVCMTCGVSSRAELDHSAEAAEKFERLIRRPFMAHLEACPA